MLQSNLYGWLELDLAVLIEISATASPRQAFAIIYLAGGSK